MKLWVLKNANEISGMDENEFDDFAKECRQSQYKFTDKWCPVAAPARNMLTESLRRAGIELQPLKDKRSCFLK